MSSKRVKRILSDLRNLKKSGLDNGEQNIWVKIDEDNIETVYALIVGSKDTPYRGGFYLFEITFPNNYPFSPPKVKFCTTNGKVRFNPNLYREGKVCLSLLGTWSGPGWTPCNKISSVLLSIQTIVLNEKPLQNEPGFENSSEKELSKYSYVVEYFNYQVAVLQMLLNPPGKFSIFHEEMIDYFLKNKDVYKDNILKLKENIISRNDIFPEYASRNYIHSGVYNMIVYPDFDGILSKIDSISCKDQLNDSIKNIKLVEEKKDLQIQRSKINKSTLLVDIQLLAKKLNIEFTKISTKTSKQIKKTKNELLIEIDLKLDK